MEATKQLPDEGWSPATARRFCARCLRDWGCPHDVVANVQIVVSELVTNVVSHAHTTAQVRLSLDDTRLRIEVADHSDDAIAAERTRGEAPGGWGIPIVEALTDSWGVDQGLGNEGKTVWAEVGVQCSHFEGESS
jgi:anti-sigma regulatory factor (Ser/Thr protein kinase)